MFSFRRDKTGFFVTIILLTIVAGTLISTFVLLIVGMAQGNWKEHLLSIKLVLGSAWVACIITVLIRLRIYKWQVDRATARQMSEAKASADEREADVPRSSE
jgi:ABC-type proline/glycine betaine transport system permease subunit